MFRLLRIKQQKGLFLCEKIQLQIYLESSYDRQQSYSLFSGLVHDWQVISWSAA